MKPQPSVIIRPFAGDDSYEELTQLLHRAYKMLADMGLRYLATHQDVATTRQRAEQGVCFIASMKDRIVGTITYYDSSATKGSPFMDKPGVGHLGQLAVEPNIQRQGVGTLLFGHAESYAAADGTIELALDTAESAQHLIGWYMRLGYSFVEYVQWGVTNYRSVVLGKRLSLPAEDSSALPEDLVKKEPHRRP